MDAIGLDDKDICTAEQTTQNSKMQGTEEMKHWSPEPHNREPDDDESNTACKLLESMTKHNHYKTNFWV